MKKTILTVLLLGAAFAVEAAETERKLPMPMADLETRFKSNCPSHVKVSSQQDELVITITEAERKGGFDRTHAINLKPLAGRTLTFVIDIKVDDLERSGAQPPSSIGQIHFGDSRQLISARHSGWHTYVFKNVKIPGNGLLKMRVWFKNISGEIRIRNPRIRGNFPKTRSSSTKKKKKKKND